jgi:hypothetical protein
VVAHQHSVGVGFEAVAEQRRPAELAHQRVGKLVEGVGQDDQLIVLAQSIDEGAGAFERSHFGDHLLDIRQAELVFAQDGEAVLHQLVVVRLVAGSAAKLRNAGARGEFDPDFGDEDAFKVEADDLHGKLPENEVKETRDLPNPWNCTETGRLIDSTKSLSNLVNSKIFSIYLLVQYKSQSLIEHIRRSWLLAPIFPEQFIAVVPPQMREGPEWFQGTADAVYQNLGLIEKRSPDLVVIFGADHIYRMDVRQMVNFHLHSHADVSIAALPVPIGEASAFGIIDADEDGSVRSFREKPTDPSPMAGDPTRAFASMGNYIFTTDVLINSMGWNAGHRPCRDAEGIREAGAVFGARAA